MSALQARDPVSLTMWNRLRILACIDVVSFHLTHEHALAAIGLPLALVVSIALGTRHREQPPLHAFVTVRLRRLIVPWVFWSIAYAVMLLLVAIKRGDPLERHFEPMMLFYGTAPGLWFLPAMALGGVLAYVVDRYTRCVPFAIYAPGCCALAAVLLLPASQVSSALAYPIPQWRFALTAFPFGLLLGRTIATESRSLWKWWFAGSVVVLLTVLAVSKRPDDGASELAIRYTSTVALLALGAVLPGRADRWTKAIEPLLLGIYLVHFVLNEYGVRAAFARLGIETRPLLMLSCTLLLSGAIVWGIRQTPLRRFV
jgi:surface polysaccharide O-acyltransferase-like enzyme